MLYLAEKVNYQLVGGDASLLFILALLSMTDAEYQLWRSSIPYTRRVSNKLDYEEFNDT